MSVSAWAGTAESGQMLSMVKRWERRALREGLCLDEQLDLSIALIEVDVISVVSAVNQTNTSLCVGCMIEDIQVLCKVFGIQKCQAISQLGNGLAHNLAFLTVSIGRDFS
ncbi:hypothetical protein ACOSQ3_000962 [Xanthoceras sorbifolium]